MYKFEVEGVYRGRGYFTVSRRTDKSVWFYNERTGETILKRIKFDIEGHEYVLFKDGRQEYAIHAEVHKVEKGVKV